MPALVDWQTVMTLAGLLINQSDYAHEMLSRVLSLRDAFTALFFVTIGVLIDPAVVGANLGLLGTLVGLIVIGNWAIWAIVCSSDSPISTSLRSPECLAAIYQRNNVRGDACESA